MKPGNLEASMDLFCTLGAIKVLLVLRIFESGSFFWLIRYVLAGKLYIYGLSEARSYAKMYEKKRN